MKKILVIAAAVLCVTAGLYAGGQEEDSLAKYRNQVTITGTLQFENGFPAISADGKTYKLFAPHSMREAYSLKPGMPLTVEGYIVQPGPRMFPDSDRPAAGEALVVKTVTIDGKSYELSPGRGFGGRDWDHPMRQGKGGWRGCGDSDRDWHGRRFDRDRGNRPNGSL
jgi:hypothetical protein